MALLLAIESSCDETAVAIVRGIAGERAEVLASEISSQIELHREHGGVVPELASRNHSLRLRTLVEKAMTDSGVVMDEIDAPLKTRQHRLGHAQIETTMTHYTHKVDADDRRVAETIGSLLSPASTVEM